MSAIGSFYLITDDKRTDIVRAAEAQSTALKKKRFGFLPPKLPLNPDPFWEFVRTNTEELEQYPYSGYLLLEIELLAPDSLGTKDAVGTWLSEIMQSSFISFRPDDAAEIIKILDGADFSNEAIRKFLVEDGREDDYPEITEPIQNSVQRLKIWLGAIPEGKTGILTIG
ncbi:MAG: hypothetical protein O3A87_03530 [Verrucomicrobia bacterium]|nr:hypothetical protein [Verrucomicrobiota bacterium]MDA1005534.1 hypothetical protein [Verrucomicrobiota bacterium]